MISEVYPAFTAVRDIIRSTWFTMVMGAASIYFLYADTPDFVVMPPALIMADTCLEAEGYEVEDQCLELP